MVHCGILDAQAIGAYAQSSHSVLQWHNQGGEKEMGYASRL